MFKLLRRLSPKQKGFALLSIVFVAVQVWLDLRLPDFMKEITQYVTTPNSEMSQIWEAGGKMMLCALGSLASSIIVGFIAAKIAAGFAMSLRHDVFSKVQTFSLGELNHFSTPSLITRSTNDITQIQMLIALGLQIIIKAPIMAVWAIIKISGTGTEWTLATGAMILFLILVVAIISILVIPRFKRIQTLTDDLNRITRENLTGLRVIRAYNAEDYQEDKFSHANNALMSNNLFASRLTAIMMPCMTLVMNGLTLSVYWIGASLISSAGMNEKMTLFSNMVVFSQYAMPVVMAFVMMTMLFIFLPRVTVSANRINEVMETKVAVRDGKGEESSPDKVGEVEFKNVSFKYPGAKDYVIQNVSFTAGKGETIAFIGSTGSGKSTIINLIPRFYDASEGEVLVDGVNVRNYTQKQLRNKLGYIPQRSVLFSGTVASNVSYGDNGEAEATPEVIKKAIDISQSNEFVSQMEGQENASISQGGSNVSGGQKQRLSIARAVCRNPEIFIFDDSFSALDYKTDKVLRHALNTELADTTSIIVAQRIGTIRDANKIIVLEQGQVVGMGTHDELMDSCEVYREIALSQLSEEELVNE